MLEQLAASLPPSSESRVGTDIDQQSRAILSYLLEAPRVEVIALPADPATCPNCGTPTTSERSPYCGTQCREEAGFVRQVRSGLREGSILDPERQTALGQVLWHVLGGGYPRRQALVPERSRARVLEQANSICVECGGAATTIDHRGSGCNRAINLRAVCEACCKEKQYQDPRFTTTPAFVARLASLAARITSPTPLRCCDDAETWDWRAFINERKESKRHAGSA